MVSGVCLCYTVSPYAIIYKSFYFLVMNIYKKFWKLENKCGRMWCSYKTACIFANDSPREAELVLKEC